VQSDEFGEVFHQAVFLDWFVLVGVEPGAVGASLTVTFLVIVRTLLGQFLLLLQFVAAVHILWQVEFAGGQQRGVHCGRHTVCFLEEGGLEQDSVVVLLWLGVFGGRSLRGSSELGGGVVETVMGEHWLGNINNYITIHLARVCVIIGDNLRYIDQTKPLKSTTLKPLFLYSLKSE
jgi:hypothetical protein